VVQLPDGHDSDAITAAWVAAKGKKVVVLCPTLKGYTGHMDPIVHPVTKLEWQPWHTKIPSWAQYVAVIDTLLGKANCDATDARWSHHRATVLTDAVAAALPNTQRPGVVGQGTGKAFGERIVALLATNKQLAIIDADLATSCGFNAAVGHERYFELGVAEQDAASFAAGLALRGGMLPVLGTYSNFLKRCFEVSRACRSRRESTTRKDPPHVCSLLVLSHTHSLSLSLARCRLNSSVYYIRHVDV
jgi:transketolase